MRNYIQTGDHLTLPAAKVCKSGDPVLIGNLFGMATHDAAKGEPLTIMTTGVFELPKQAAAVFTSGDLAYLDPASLLCVKAGAGMHLIGTLVQPAGNGTTVAIVRLNGITTTVV